MTNPKTEPLVKAVKKAYRESELYHVERLLAEQSRWQRKRTIAENKLADVRKRIDEKLKELATPKGEPKNEPVRAQA